MNIVKFQKDSTLQRIKASYIDESFKLTEHEEEIKKRLVHYHSLIFDKKYTKSQAIKIHCREMTGKDGKPLSKATAYRDAIQSQYIMGDVLKVNVEFERAMLQENYYQLYQMAIKKGDLMAAKGCLDSYAALVDFKADDIKINPEKLAASDYIIRLNKSAKQMFKKQFDRGVIDLNDIDVEDVDYKEVDPDE